MLASPGYQRTYLGVQDIHSWSWLMLYADIFSCCRSWSRSFWSDFRSALWMTDSHTKTLMIPAKTAISGRVMCHVMKVNQTIQPQKMLARILMYRIWLRDHLIPQWEVRGPPKSLIGSSHHRLQLFHQWKVDDQSLHRFHLQKLREMSFVGR